MGGVVSHPVPTSAQSYHTNFFNGEEINGGVVSHPAPASVFSYHTEFFSGEKSVENNWEGRIREGRNRMASSSVG